MTPEQIAQSGSEHAHQTALFAWCAQSGISELKWLFAIPNGFYATPQQKAKMKTEGLRSGVSDIMLPVHIDDAGDGMGYCGLFIEMKHKKYENARNGGLSDEQIEFRNFIIGQGYQFALCYTWTEARDVILKYLGRR